jgi:ATP-dependent helicase HrpA
MCKQRFLSPLRLMEWMEVRQQLQRQCKELKLRISSSEAAPDNIHRALLSGLLANVAVKTEKRDYLGTRNRHLQIFPGSGLFKKAPKWIMAGEVIETSKLYARQVAGIQPEWVEQLADHLLQRSYRDAHWQRNQGTVGAYEQSTLYGLIINAKKRVNYARINPTESRQIFIRDGLVEGGLKTSGDFYRYNLALLDEVTSLEEKSRRRDIVVDPEELVRFYDAIIPDDVCTAAAFEQFREQAEREQPRALYFSRDMLVVDDAVEVSAQEYPDQLDIGDMVLPLRYHFAPGETDDGVSLLCPVDVLNRLSATRCEWLVPGMLEEKVTLLIKGLPKHLRRNFVPAPDFARACVQALTPGDGALTTALSRQLQRMSGVEVQQSCWQSATLPAHLQMRYQVIDNQGQTLQAGRDLPVLQKAYVSQVEESLLRFSDNSIEREQVSDWNFGDLPLSVEISKSGITLQGYPALQATEQGVGIKLFATAAAAGSAMPAGVRALYRQVLREEIKYLQRKLPGIDVLALRFTPFGSKQALIADIIDAALDASFMDVDKLPRTRDAFMQKLEAARHALVPVAGRICSVLEQILELHRQVAKRVGGSLPLSWVEAVGDLRDQIDRLVYVGFVQQTGLQQLQRMPVYFQAMGRRLDAIDMGPDKDRRHRAELLPVWEAFKLQPATRDDDPLYAAAYTALRWSFEELRISLFAQDLVTREKVSVSRLESRLKSLQD